MSATFSRPGWEAACELSCGTENPKRRERDGGIEPVIERHAGAARGGLGPLADGWIDASALTIRANSCSRPVPTLAHPPAPTASRASH